MFGAFMLGLPDETEESMNRTIEFANRLPLDIAKFNMTVPFPGTPYFKELKAAGRIRTEDWSKYLFHKPETPVFDHVNLSWDTHTTSSLFAGSSSTHGSSSAG